jgi:hypothetical protein
LSLAASCIISQSTLLLSAAMQPHEQRVIQEKADNDAKLEKLNAFIDCQSPSIFEGLSEKR